MTAVALDRPAPANGPAKAGLGPVLLAILFAVAIAASAHAIAKHAAEAARVINGCNQRGPTQMWEAIGHANDGGFWLICETDDGDYGVRKIRCTKRGWMGETAFIPDESQLAKGSLERAIEYVSGKARRWAGKLSEVCQ